MAESMHGDFLMAQQIKGPNVTAEDTFFHLLWELLQIGQMDNKEPGESHVSQALQHPPFMLLCTLWSASSVCES